jgi:AsmA protein
MKGLSLDAKLSCKELRTQDVSVSALEASVIGKDGVFELDPVTMRIFGGRMTGRLQADCSGSVPGYQFRCSLPRFRIEEFLKTLSPERAAVGPMDFSASLSMQGTTLRQMVQTSTGEASLRGEGLVLEGHDLDRELSRFKSSQRFNLVDVGAVFFAGPLGLTVTRGYSFSSLFLGSGGRSNIRTLRSNWRVERGVARAKDVAMATSKNRIALQGGLDFVHGQFENVTVAAIDANGCARVRQVIHGPFANPTVDKPNVLESVAGPVIKVFKLARHLLPAGHCEVFYSGSVAAPG